MRSLVVLLFGLLIDVLTAAVAKTVLELFLAVVLSAAHSACAFTIVTPRDFAWFVFAELTNEFGLFAS
jgi:hypothetical protein